jgi:hypothetical protein
LFSLLWLDDSLTAELMLVLDSTVILGSKSNGINNHNLLSDSFGSLQITP